MCSQYASKPGRLVGAGRNGLGGASAAIALFMPKCPLCVAAWAWALSALGVDFDRWHAIRWPLTAGFMLLAAMLLGFRARPWVKAAVLFGSGLCLSIKVAENSSSFIAALVLGLGLSAVAATGLVRLSGREHGAGARLQRKVG